MPARTSAAAGVHTRQGVGRRRLPGVDASGARKSGGPARAARARCGETRPKPREPPPGLARDRSMEALQGNGTASALRSAIAPASRPGSELSGLRSAAFASDRRAPPRVRWSGMSGALDTSRTDRYGKTNDCHRRREGRRRRGRRSGRGRAAARGVRPGRRTPAVAPGRPRRSAGRGKPWTFSRTQEPATAGTPARARVSAGISQNQSTEPWISQTIEGNSAAAPTARRRRIRDEPGPSRQRRRR